MKDNKSIMVIYPLLLISLISFGTSYNQVKNLTKIQVAAVSEQFVQSNTAKTNVGTKKTVEDILSEINIEASAVFVQDLTSGEIFYERDAYRPYPLASLTKLMVAKVAGDILRPDAVITIADKHLIGSGDGSLFAGERWSYKNLQAYTLIVSSNAGSRAIADEAYFKWKGERATSDSDFTTYLNDVAKTIGLKQSYFINATGLDTGEFVNGAYGSAQDVGTLFAEIFKTNPELIYDTSLNETTLNSLDGYRHRAKNTNEITQEIPALVASKTGYTLLAGGNLAIIFDVEIARPVVVVVLGSTRNGRFTDVIHLVRATQDYLDQE